MKAAPSIQRKGKVALYIPLHIRVEVGKYTLCCGTQAARENFASKYPQYKFEQTSVND